MTRKARLTNTKVAPCPNKARADAAEELIKHLTEVNRRLQAELVVASGRSAATVPLPDPYGLTGDDKKGTKPSELRRLVEAGVEMAPNDGLLDPYGLLKAAS